MLPSIVLTVDSDLEPQIEDIFRVINRGERDSREHDQRIEYYSKYNCT